MERFKKVKVIKTMQTLSKEGAIIFSDGIGTVATVNERISNYKDIAKRIESSWNACTKFDNPESDISKLISALKQVNSDTETYWDKTNLQISQNTLISINEVLALIKE